MMCSYVQYRLHDYRDLSVFTTLLSQCLAHGRWPILLIEYMGRVIIINTNMRIMTIKLFLL